MYLMMTIWYLCTRLSRTLLFLILFLFNFFIAIIFSFFELDSCRKEIHFSKNSPYENTEHYCLQKTILIYPRNRMYEVKESLNVVMFFTRQTYPNKHDSSRVFPSPNDLQHCLTFSLVFIWLYSQNVKSQIEYNYTEHGTFLMFRVLITFTPCTSSHPFLCHVVRFVRVCSNLFFYYPKLSNLSTLFS